MQAFYAHIPDDRDVFVVGDLPDAFALLISGVVWVYYIGETGRELTLYRFCQDESCILTPNATLCRKAFTAAAKVKEDA